MRPRPLHAFVDVASPGPLVAAPPRHFVPRHGTSVTWFVAGTTAPGGWQRGAGEQVVRCDSATAVPVAVAFHVAEQLCANERTGATPPVVIIVSCRTELRSLVTLLNAKGHEARAQQTLEQLFEEDDDL